MNLIAPTVTSWAQDSSLEQGMRLALDQAHNAWLVGEVPVGAVICRYRLSADYGLRYLPVLMLSWCMRRQP
ncbi:MAG: hypothetical protein U5L74_01980 [Ideonella sp.]|nr:hypothetical protein [Ideonella sp.]